MYYFLDTALREVEQHIIAGAPERGGALLGLPHRRVITRFVFDADAETSAASFRPSRELATRVRDLETSTGLQFKGIAHSHPGGFDRPSEQDRREVGVGLGLNPHLANYALPILTLSSVETPKVHELPLAGGKLSSYVARRTDTNEAAVDPEPCAKVPLARDLDAVQEAYDAQNAEVFITQPGPELMIAGKVTWTEETELVMLVTEQYPLTAPILLLTLDGTTTQLHPSWQLMEPPEQRLIVALADVMPKTMPWAHGFGPWGSARVLTNVGERASDAGWPALIGTPTIAAREERLQRQSALAPIGTPHIFLLGAGSVGSVLAESLVRSGVSSLTVCDPDVVEAANLSRTVYELCDLGQSKVTALRRVLLQIDPDANVQTIGQSFQDIDSADLKGQIEQAELVIAASDDPAAQRLLNAVAYECGVPAVFPGLYAGAEGGEVIFTQPEQTPCFLCAKAARYALDDADPDPAHDYGTGRLVAQVALAADIHHLTTAAAKICLGLLSPRGSPASSFVDDACGSRVNYLTMGMTPQFWFYPAVFGSVPSQYAYQSVWLAPERQADCIVCGERDHRRGFDVAEPTLAELRELAVSPVRPGSSTHRATFTERLRQIISR